jgi:acyl carrier protein
MLATIWAEVLKADKVGIHDNFFDLGGHSLTLIRLHAKTQAALKRKLQLLAFFQYPTINDFSAYISGRSENRYSVQESQRRGQKRRQAARVRSRNESIQAHIA